MGAKAAVVIGVSGLVALAFAVLVHPAPFGVDARVHSAFVHHHVAVGFFRAVTMLGALSYLLVLVVACLPTTSRRDVRFVVAVIAAGLVAIVVRHVVADAMARPRPPRADWLVSAGGGSFPSGHTTAAAILVRGPVASTGRRLLAAAWLLLALAVGLSRVVLGVHWPTDVVGGWLVGLTFWGVGSLIASRRAPSRP